MSDESPAETGERGLAAELFNGVWTLLEKPDRTVEDDERRLGAAPTSCAADDRMVHMAHASRYQWGQAGTELNRSRGEWQCSRV